MKFDKAEIEKIKIPIHLRGKWAVGWMQKVLDKPIQSKENFLVQDDDQNYLVDSKLKMLIDSLEHFALKPEGGGISAGDRKSTRLNSSHTDISRMPSSA